MLDGCAYRGAAVPTEIKTRPRILLLATFAFGLTSLARAQTQPTFGVTLNTGGNPADQALVGVKTPITLSGTVASSSPTAVIVDGIPVNGRPLPNTFVQSGGSWQITVDTTSLVTIAQTPGFILTNSSGLTTFGIVGVNGDGTSVSYSTAFFSDFTSILTADFGQGFGWSSPNEGDPSLALHLYIDYIAPTVTFKASATSLISGTVTDNFQLGTLTLSIQDLTDPASSYFNEDSSGNSFNSSVPLEVDIPIEHGAGVTSSPWQYDDGVLQAGRVYRVTAIATDAVNNVSTTTTDIAVVAALNDAVAGATPAAKSAFNISFSDSKFEVQFSATPTRVNGATKSPYYCGSWNNGASDPGYWLKSANGNVIPVRTNVAGCEIEMTISANTAEGYCPGPDDTVYVMSGKNQVGQFDGTVLVPALLTPYKTDIVNTPSVKGERWTQVLTGDPDMDLTGQDYGEHLDDPSPIPMNFFFDYPLCGQPDEMSGKIGDPTWVTRMAACDPSNVYSGPNRFCDELSVTGINVAPRKPFLGLINPTDIVCGQETVHTYYINGCTFPPPPIKFRDQILLHAPKAAPITVSITRSEK